ncbi:MAG: undecaprenyl-diphosphatase UppP [Desulfobacteraceae bacterium]|nr:undecaprenyl-diphosphatase UppP [Desulfobacteraceae bacterium]
MNTIQAIILGIIQGLTEFLPISSSGHLVIFQHLFGMKEPALFFDISVHMGTLAAVIIFFRKDIWSIIISVVNSVGLVLKKQASLADVYKNPDIKLTLLIIIGSVPTAFLGLMFKEIADQLFSSVFIVGCTLIITGSFLWLTRLVKKNIKNIEKFSVKDALVIGVAQGIAIIPGISRSGSTIATGFFLGLDRETATRYSFLLSIPAILGAEILSLKDVSVHAIDTTIILGTLTAGIVGYGALNLLVYMIKKGQLHIFAPYCWLAGVAALIWGW